MQTEVILYFIVHVQLKGWGRFVVWDFFLVISNPTQISHKVPQHIRFNRFFIRRLVHPYYLDECISIFGFFM